jgi:hypothetical protein
VLACSRDVECGLLEGLRLVLVFDLCSQGDTQLFGGRIGCGAELFRLWALKLSGQTRWRPESLASNVVRAALIPGDAEQCAVVWGTVDS